MTFFAVQAVIAVTAEYSIVVEPATYFVPAGIPVKTIVSGIAPNQVIIRRTSSTPDLVVTIMTAQALAAISFVIFVVS